MLVSYENVHSNNLSVYFFSHHKVVIWCMRPLTPRYHHSTTSKYNKSDTGGDVHQLVSALSASGIH